MRKLIASFVLAGFALGVVGCGGDKPAPKKDDKAAAPAPAPAEGDKAAPAPAPAKDEKAK